MTPTTSTRTSTRLGIVYEVLEKTDANFALLKEFGIKCFKHIKGDTDMFKCHQLKLNEMAEIQVAWDLDKEPRMIVGARVAFRRLGLEREDGRGFIWVEPFVIHPEYRLKGIGTMLSGFGIERAKLKGYTLMGCHVHPKNSKLLHHLVDKFGYKLVEHNEIMGLDVYEKEI